MPTQLAAPELVAEEPSQEESDELAVEDELLIEEVSIDGMCGVY
jgi:mycofactocin precursor